LPATGQLRIGRAKDADFRLSDPSVSRSHCLLQMTERGAVLTDAGSQSGTLVNEKSISEHRLKPGDVIQIGNTELRFGTGGVEDQPTITAMAAQELLSQLGLTGQLQPLPRRRKPTLPAA